MTEQENGGSLRIATNAAHDARNHGSARWDHTSEVMDANPFDCGPDVAQLYAKMCVIVDRNENIVTQELTSASDHLVLMVSAL